MNMKCENVIMDRRRQLAENCQNDDEERCMVDALIKHTEKDEQNPISDVELLDNVKTFYIAGSETTSVAISWAIFYLSQNKEACLQVRKESESFMANNWESLKGTKSVTSVLKYTNAVVKEAIRLNSPATMVGGELISTTESHTLSNGIVVHPGNLILNYVQGSMLEESVFTNASKFDPSRWLLEDADKLTKMNQSFLAFGSGRRICPGMGLAYNEAVVAVAVLISSLDFELDCPVEEVKPIVRFTTQPNKMPMRIKVRA